MTNQVNKSTSVGWVNHDAWSEMYVGVHWLVMEELPEHTRQGDTRHGPLSQLALIGAHHLVEVMFFHSVKVLLTENPGDYLEIEDKYNKRPKFKAAFENWPKVLVGREFDRDNPAIKSVLKLADRRNDTIHKESALVIPSMARSALYSAVYGCREISVHLLGPGQFKYENVLKKYALPDANWFHETELVDTSPDI